MGMYDDIEVGDRYGQVKLWSCTMETFHQGQEVPEAEGETFSIAMREGGYVYIVGGIVSDWQNLPMTNAPIVDKYGTPFEADAEGLFGERYFFEEAKDG
jgi:hypothetical protein